MPRHVESPRFPRTGRSGTFSGIESFYSYEERANALEALGGMFSCLSMLMIDRSISRRFPSTDTQPFSIRLNCYSNTCTLTK